MHSYVDQINFLSHLRAIQDHHLEDILELILLYYYYLPHLVLPLMIKSFVCDKFPS